MDRRILLFLGLLLLVSPAFALTFQEFVTTYFNELVSLMIFVVAFSMIFTVMPTWSDSINVNAIIALSIALVLAGANYTNADFSNILYNFLFAVPYGLAVLLLLLIVINILFNPNKNIKIITSILLALIFVIILLSGDVISVEAPAQEGFGTNMIIFFTIIIILFIILTAFLARKIITGKKTPGTGKSFVSGLSQDRREKIASVEDEITTLVEKEDKDSLVRQFHKFLSNYNDKGVLNNFLNELSALLKQINGNFTYQNENDNKVINDNEFILDNFKAIYNSITSFAMRINRRRVLLTYYWALIQWSLNNNEYDKIRGIYSWKDFNNIIKDKTKNLNEIKKELSPKKIEETEAAEKEVAHIKKIIGLGVPPFKWIDLGACGLTSIRMVVDYYKSNLIPDLINKYEKYYEDEVGSLSEDKSVREESFISYLLLKYFEYVLSNENYYVSKDDLINSVYPESKNIVNAWINKKEKKSDLINKYSVKFKKFREELMYLMQLIIGKNLKFEEHSNKNEFSLLLKQNAARLKSKEELPSIINIGDTHFVVFNGYDNEGNILINDPDPENKDNKLNMSLVQYVNILNYPNGTFSVKVEDLFSSVKEVTEQVLINFSIFLNLKEEDKNEILLKIYNFLDTTDENKLIKYVHIDLDKNLIYNKVNFSGVSLFITLKESSKVKEQILSLLDFFKNIKIDYFNGKVLEECHYCKKFILENQSFCPYCKEPLINKLKITNLELNMKSVAAMQFKNAGADKKLFDLIWDGFLPVHKKLLKNEQKTIEYSKVLKNFKDVVKNLTKMDSIMIDDIEELVNIDKEFIKNQELQEPYLSDWGKLWVKLGNLFTKTETLGKAEEPDIARAENLRKLLTDEEGNLIVAEEVIQKLAELQDNEYVLFYYKKNYFVYQKLGSTLFFQPLHKLFVESELNVDKILPLLRGFAEGFKFTSNNLFFLILNKKTQPTKSKFISVNSQRFSPSDPNFLKKNIEILYNNIFEALNLPEKKREEIEQQELIDEKKIKNKLSEIGKKERKTTQRELNLFSEKYKDKGILSILQEIKKELKSGTDETQEKLNILFLLLAKESFIPPLKENINKKNFWAARNSFIKNFKTNKLKFIETLKKDVERLIKFIKIPLLKDFLNTQGIILNNDEIELDDKYYLLFQNNKFVSVYNNFLLIPKFVFKTNTFFEANETKLEKIFPYPEADKDNYSFIIITKDNYNEINEIKEGFVFREDEIKEIKEDSEKRKKVIKIRNLRPLKIESLEVDFTNYSEKKELDDQKFNNLDKQEPAKKEDEDKDKDSKPLAPSGSKMQSLKHSSPEFVEAVEEEKEEFDNEFGNTQIGKRTLSKWKGIANNNPEREANINVYSAFYNEVTNNFKHKFANTPFMKKLIELSEYFLKIDLNVPDKFFQKSPEISYPAKIRYGIKDGKKTIYCLNHSTSEIAEITPNLLKKIDNDFYNYLCINLARIINFEKFKKVLAEIRIEQMPIGMSFKIPEEEKKDNIRIIKDALTDLIKKKNKFVKEILYLDSIHIIWEENYVFYNKNVLNIGFRHFEPPFDYALFKELIVEAFENPEKKAGYNEKSIMEKVEDAVEGLNQEK